MICVIQHEFDEFNVLNSQELLRISDMAAACYCGCNEQLEPEQIELLAAMTDVAIQPCARGNLRKAHRDAVHTLTEQ